MKNKRVLVTGGAGFIGSNLAEKLAEENEVVILDDLSTGKIETIEELIKKDTVTFTQGSITDLDLLRKNFRDIDFVFHQAAIASVPKSIKDPRSSNEANITGTLNVLIAAKDAGIKKLVFASSSSVYGDTPLVQVSEDMPLNPLSPYAVTKAAGEFYSKVFHDLYDLQTISLRYFNVFGPKQDPDSQYAAVIPKFINAIMNDEQPVIYGDGEQSRDFIFVKHVVEANILACESGMTGVFNIANGKRITINQLVSMINEILGKNIEPVYTEPVSGDIKHSMADISKARSIGYKPESDFKKELRETISWFSRK